MKTKLQILTQATLVIPAAIWLATGCSSLESKHVTDRIDPATPSIPAVESGYDTIGRMWTEGPGFRTKTTAKRTTGTEKAEKPPKAPKAPKTAKTTGTEPGPYGPSVVKQGTTTPPPSQADRGPQHVVGGGLVSVDKRVPAEAAIGETYCYTIVIVANDNVGNVVVTDEIPEGASYVSSEPPATVEGKIMTWKFKSMKRGERKTIRVCLKAEKEGELIGCVTVKADPMDCATTLVGKADVYIQKDGPAHVTLNSNATYTITVTNRGNITVRNVVVTENVPDGLSHASGKTSLVYNIGDLEPKRGTNIVVTFKATKTGTVRNTATMVNDTIKDPTTNEPKKFSDDAVTQISQAGVRITKTGDKTAFINKKARYKITVSNTGNTEFTNLTLTDNAPVGNSIVSTSGAQVTANTAVWRIPSLKPGEEKSYEITLTSKMKGEYCNTATLTGGNNVREEARACTMWEGVSALLLEVSDEPDPILVDDTVAYTIRVTNQGTADVLNVGVTANLNKLLQPIASANATIDGQNVKFPTIPRLGSKQTQTYILKAKGVTPGDGRVKVSLSSEIFQVPVVEEESTRIY